MNLSLPIFSCIEADEESIEIWISQNSFAKKLDYKKEEKKNEDREWPWNKIVN